MGWKAHPASCGTMLIICRKENNNFVACTCWSLYFKDETIFLRSLKSSPTATPSLTWPLETVATAQASMKIDYHRKADYAHKSVIVPTWKTRGRRRKRGRRRESGTENEGFVATMTRSRGDHTALRPHLSQKLQLQSPLAAVHSQAVGGGGSARGYGVPPQVKARFMHTHSRYSSSHHTHPLDLAIKTQEQISPLVTAAQKQMIPNTWLLYGP